MDLTRISDLAVLLALFYVGLCVTANGWRARKYGAVVGALVLWALAALHAICHLGGR